MRQDHTYHGFQKGILIMTGPKAPSRESNWTALLLWTPNNTWYT